MLVLPHGLRMRRTWFGEEARLPLPQAPSPDLQFFIPWFAVSPLSDGRLRLPPGGTASAALTPQLRSAPADISAGVPASAGMPSHPFAGSAAAGCGSLSVWINNMVRKLKIQGYNFYGISVKKVCFFFPAPQSLLRNFPGLFYLIAAQKDKTNAKRFSKYLSGQIRRSRRTG